MKIEIMIENFNIFLSGSIFQMNISDWTSNRWATVFADEAEKILGEYCVQRMGENGKEREGKQSKLMKFIWFTIGKTSDEIGTMSENDPEGLSAFLQTQHFKSFMFKLRSKVETYGDSQRNKISVQKVEPINYKEYNDYLIKNIQRLTGVGKH